jgi:hypothetical protein
VILASGIYHEIPLNTSDIPQSELNIENKFRSNPLAWNGQFSPQLIQVLLKQYAKANTTLLDPFVGSGTVLLEAGRAGLSAKGTEINPAAVVLAQIYEFINVPHDRRGLHLNAVQEILRDELPDNLPIFNESQLIHQQLDEGTIKSKLINLLSSVEDRLQCRLLETLVVLLDFYRPGLSLDRVLAIWHRLAKLVMQLPYSTRPIEVHLADARKTPFHSSSIDLVVTSPPYINVFNYHQQYRASMEAMSWNLLKVARSEIGSNRKHRGNRFLTVIQYCLDMAQVFREMARVSHATSRLIFVVGRESTVRGTKFFNGEIVAEVAHEVLGFDLILRQERVFVNRYGQNIFEDILHFSPPHSISHAELLADARKAAKGILEAAYDSAPAKARSDLKFAIDQVEAVKPSPIFNLTKILSDEHLWTTGATHA